MTQTTKLKYTNMKSNSPIYSRSLLRNTAITSVALSILSFLRQAVDDEKMPNFILLWTDDFGYSDISCYGAQKVNTPHIDCLAADGIRFTDFHTAASICSPSRAAFLTGGYPQRAGLYMGINP
ncbi:MAG: sulfatase-like hydrolase/transferase, partial [Opitutales bacterium]|nr:sulfatase-like hydrolase/transferase [Opitutales bacterium]